MGRRGEARPTPGIPIAHPRASRARIVAVAVRKLTVFAWHFLTKGREYMRVCPNDEAAPRWDPQDGYAAPVQTSSSPADGWVHAPTSWAVAPAEQWKGAARLRYTSRRAGAK